MQEDGGKMKRGGTRALVIGADHINQDCCKKTIYLKIAQAIAYIQTKFEKVRLHQ